MEKLYLPQLEKAVDATAIIEVQEFIKELETLTPVQGVVKVIHQGSFLEVKAQAHAIVTLTCDRTLNQFNHRLSVNVSELIWLAEPITTKFSKEQEINIEDLVESLPPNGYFDVETWLYEQLCLAIPFQKIAPDAPSLEEILGTTAPPVPTVDKRWAALANLQISDHETL